LFNLSFNYYLQTSPVPIELDALDSEPASRQTQMATLVCLVTVQSSTLNPLTIRILTFISRKYAHYRIARSIDFKRHS